MGILLLLVLSLLFTAVAPLREAPQSSCKKVKAYDRHLSSTPGIHLPLLHPRSPCSPAALPPLPFSTVLRQDDRRVRSLCSRLHPTTASLVSVHRPSSSISSPLYSGTSLGLGNYITKISLGTPSSSHAMVVDTGSSLTWLQCHPCNISCHPQSSPIFKPSSSSSYSPVPCSSPHCSSAVSATLNPSSCSRSNTCVYQASYGDSSFSIGLLSKDTLKLGTALTVHGFIYGCGQDNQGIFGKAAGIIGLARNNLSFISQAAGKAGAFAFSYCLPTLSSTGSLSLGHYDASRFSFTPMVDNFLAKALYFVNLTGITVGGDLLPISPSSYDTPTIIDSGTVISRLPPNVYNALSEAVVAAAEEKEYERAAGFLILDTCFVGRGEEMELPAVSLVFNGGAEMRLRKRNVMIDVDGRTTCLAFAEATRLAIVGNRQQQTFNVVYDVDRSRIGFAGGGCG